MLQFLYTLHSHNRWLILIVLALVFLKLLMVWVSKSEFAKADRALYSSFLALMGIQFIVGVYLIFNMGFEPRYRIEHAATMLIAFFLAHVPLRWKTLPGPVRAKRTAIMLLVIIILIIVGILRLPQGFATRALA